MLTTSVLRAALLSAAAIATTASATAQSNGANQLNAEAIPEVVVQQPPVAKPRQRPTAQRAAPRPIPAAAQGSAADPSADSNDLSGPDAAGMPLGDPTPRGAGGTSLTVPTTGQARREIYQTPGAVAVVSDKDYKIATPAVTIKDALDYVPGVFVQPKWGEDSRLSIRGSGLSRNFHGRGVTLLMDGVIPITTSDGASDFQEIDPTAYRYIEVYKGGNALQYGANSLGGAVNFVMPTGYDTDAFGGRIDAGAFGLYKLSASSGGVYGAADYFITGTWQEQDGFRDHSDGFSGRGAMNIGYRLSENAETRFYLNANHVRQKIPGAVTRDEALNNPSGAFVRPGEPAGFLGVGNDNVDRDYERNIDSVRVANKTTVRVAPETLVEFGGFYFNRHLDHPILLVVDNKNNEVGGFGRITDERMIGGNRNRFVAGVSVHHGDIHATTYRTILGERGALLSDADQISTTTTIYGQNSFYLAPSLALVGGVQYTNIDRRLEDNFLANGDESRAAGFDFVSPKIGFLWDVAYQSQLYGNISESKEAATFNEITFVTGNTLTLKPQEALTYELGLRGGTDRLRYDLAVYRSNIDNEFQCQAVVDPLTGAITNTGTCTQVNLDKTLHQGIEAGVSAEVWRGVFAPSLADALWVNAAYTYSDFRFDDDARFGNNQLPGAPEHYLRAELIYKHPSGVFAGPNVEWVPEAYFVDSANTFSTKAYALLGAKLGFDDGGPVTAYIEGRNLTDEAYISSASVAVSANASSALFEPGNGRAVYGGVSYKW